jgi:hypothetical protein
MTRGANAEQKREQTNYLIFLVFVLSELVHLTAETKISKNSGLMKKFNYQKALGRSQRPEN